MFSSYNKSATWLKMAWMTNCLLFFTFLQKATVALFDSNYILVGYFTTPSFSFGFIESVCSYKITPFNYTCILLVVIISLLVQLYSFDYMFLDPFLNSFFVKLTFFTVSFLFLLVTDDLFFLLIAWEAVGLSSFLLISFYSMRVRALKASLTALLYNKVGDVFLLIGVSACLAVNTSSISLFSALTLFDSNVQTNHLTLACFIVAGMTKSAQFLFHVWLPEAMEGPTPVSSLLHAATMVTAGVYLLTKIPNNAPLLINQLLVLSSSVTAFWCSFYAFTQTDIKKIIAYSTASQLAFMFLSLSMLRFDLGLFHLIEHGFFKALLFLTAGTILSSKNDEQDTRVLGSFAKILPFPFSNLSNGFANLIATPCFAGYYSKELIVTLVFLFYQRNNHHLQFFAQAFTLSAVLFTCLYTFKFFYLQYFNNQQRYSNLTNSVQNNINMCVSMFILFYLSCTGLFLTNYFTGDLFHIQLKCTDTTEILMISTLQINYNTLLHNLPLFLFIPYFIVTAFLFMSYFYLSTCFFYCLHDYLLIFFLFADSFAQFKTMYASKLIDLLVFDYTTFVDVPLSIELNKATSGILKQYNKVAILLLLLFTMIACVFIM